MITEITIAKALEKAAEVVTKELPKKIEKEKSISAFQQKLDSYQDSSAPKRSLRIEGERMNIDLHQIPDKNGMNKEKRTLEHIGKKPIVQESIDAVDNNVLKNEMKECNKMRVGEEVTFKKDETGQVDFEKYAVGPTSDIPYKTTADYLERMASSEHSHYESGQMTSDEFKSIVRRENYSYMQQTCGERWGVSATEAGKLIGKGDLAIHESANGTMYLVPNNLHNAISHKGYVSKMAAEAELLKR